MRAVEEEEVRKSEHFNTRGASCIAKNKMQNILFKSIKESEKPRITCETISHWKNVWNWLPECCNNFMIM